MRKRLTGTHRHARCGLAFNWDCVYVSDASLGSIGFNLTVSIPSADSLTILGETIYNAATTTVEQVLLVAIKRQIEVIARHTPSTSQFATCATTPR